MKTMFEYMGTMIMMIIISFVMFTYISIELQEVLARNYHTRLVERIQYEGSYNEAVNKDYGDNIRLTLNNDNTIKVVYDYDIKAPIIGTIKAVQIVGYAR